MAMEWRCKVYNQSTRCYLSWQWLCNYIYQNIICMSVLIILLQYPITSAINCILHALTTANIYAPNISCMDSVILFVRTQQSCTVCNFGILLQSSWGLRCCGCLHSAAWVVSPKQCCVKTQRSEDFKSYIICVKYLSATNTEGIWGLGLYRWCCTWMVWFIHVTYLNSCHVL